MRNPPDVDLSPAELASAPNYLGNPELVSALIRGWLDPCLARRNGKSGPAFALKESKGRIVRRSLGALAEQGLHSALENNDRLRNSG